MNKDKDFCKHGTHVNIRCIQCEAENMCHSCRVSNGWKRKDRASHTARVKFCQKCGEKKAILPLRHYLQ